MDKILSTFDHPAYKSRSSIWFLSSVPHITKFIHAVKVSFLLLLYSLPAVQIGARVCDCCVDYSVLMYRDELKQ